MSAFRTTKSAGLTLTELLVVVAILAILVSIAVPSSRKSVERVRVQGTAESLRSDFQEARMLAIGTGRTVRMRFDRVGAGVCALTYQGALDACRCNDAGEPICKPSGRLLRNTWIPDDRGVDLSTTAAQITVEGERGLVTPATTLKVTGSLGHRIDHIVALTGRIRSCSVGEAAMAPCAS